VARLVVLRFENDQEADVYVDTLLHGYTIFIPIPGQVGRDKIKPTVEMVVQTPTLFCDCSYRGDGWRRGEKRGWWVHNGCGKPSIGWGENPRAVIGEAVDLLEKPSKNTDERLQHIKVENDDA
jgi:hypothetical protein